MSYKNTSAPYWSVYALTLQRILNTYRMGLGHLDDRVGIHREKVRRLIRSLHTPDSLPVLNPDEAQLLFETIHIRQEDRWHLHAALLATAIQRLLSQRIELEDARLAAEQMLPIIHDAVIKHKNTRGLGNVRGDIDPLEDNEFDLMFALPLEMIDQGNEALYLSRDATSHTERVRRTRFARGCFEEAAAELVNFSRNIRLLPDWQHRHDEAQKGLESVKDRLEDLGEE